MTPDEYCAAKAARSGSSLYYSLLFLPAEQRRAVTALHAFQKEVGGIADQCPDADVARTRLDWWRSELQRCFEGRASHPVTRALQDRVRQMNLPAEYFHEMLDGVEMDLGRTRYDSFRQLALYCHRAAGVLGLLSAEVLGYQHRGTLHHAQELGTALQLTRMLVNVRHDTRQGRLYLPLDELLEFGVNPHDLLAGRTPPGLPRLFHFQAERARDYYRRALRHLPQEDRYRQRSGLILARINQTLLGEIEADGYRLVEHRIELTPLRKLWIAWSTARRERRRRRERPPRA